MGKLKKFFKKGKKSSKESIASENGELEEIIVTDEVTENIQSENINEEGELEEIIIDNSQSTLKDSKLEDLIIDENQLGNSSADQTSKVENETYLKADETDVEADETDVVVENQNAELIDYDEQQEQNLENEDMANIYLDEVVIVENDEDNAYNESQVTFAENTPEEDNSVSATVHDGGDTNVPTYMGTIVSISPGDQLVFNVTDEQKETVDILNIKNVHTKTVAFKVKTTNPNNYRVRPSTSLIKPGETASVNIYLQPGAYDTIDRDKFLIMVMEVNDDVVNATEISSQWKLRPAENMYMEHRLYCIMKQVRFEDQLQNGSVRDTMAEDLQVIRQKKVPSKSSAQNAKIKSLEDRNKKFVEVLLGQQVELEQSMAKMFKAVVLLVLVVFVALALFVFAYVYQAVEDDKLLTECREGNA